jgi:ornithine lipid ester-linked acyl 2-hydroxylase
LLFYKNCKLCPNIYNILLKIPNKKTALLSRLKANTKLDAHMGWGDLANYILRCHYGVIVPDNCYIHVMNEKRKIKEKKIIVFDDSKMHYAENKSNTDRIILIIDMPRPSNIPIGTSNVKKSDELLKLINSPSFPH